MPRLTIVNLTVSEIDIQDPQGLSDLEIFVKGSATVTTDVAADYLARIEPQLKSLATRSDITYSVVNDPTSLADDSAPAVRVALTTPVTVLATDEIVVCKLTSPGAVSVVLPSALPIGASIEILDGTGDANVNNITIDPEGADTINGGATKVLVTSYSHVKCVKIAAGVWVAGTLASPLASYADVAAPPLAQGAVPFGDGSGKLDQSVNLTFDKTNDILTTTRTLPAGTSIVHVNKAGNDAHGNGSALAPFLTIGAGITAAAGLTPSLAAPAVVIVGPGTYTENVVLQPFVYLVGHTHNDFGALAATISGSVTVTDVSSGNNRYCIQDFQVSTGPVTVDFSGKGGGTSFFYIVGGNTRVTTNFTGPNGFVLFVGGTFNGGAWNTIGVTLLEGARHFTTTIAASGNLSGSVNVNVSHGCAVGALTLTSSAIAVIHGELQGALNVATGCTADLTAACFNPTSASFTGPGAINRPRLNASTGALSAGSQVVNFAIPFMDATYNVQLQQTGGSGAVPPIVTAKAAGNFTVTVPSGGATYDYTVVHN